jgi:hypothetical protein
MTKDLICACGHARGDHRIIGERAICNVHPCGCMDFVEALTSNLDLCVAIGNVAREKRYVAEGRTLTLAGRDRVALGKEIERMRAALDLIAGTHGTECGSPRMLAAQTLAGAQVETSDRETLSTLRYELEQFATAVALNDRQLTRLREIARSVVRDGALCRSAEETSAARTARETIEVLSRWIVQRGQDLRDHACPQCVPEGGDLVNPSYVCAFHLAQEYARTPVKASCRHVFDFIPFMGIVCTKCAVEATTETIPPGHSTHHWVEQGAGMICDGCGLIRGPQPLPSDK